MFSDVTIGLLAAIGGGTWIYSKMYRSTGGNNTSAIVVAGCAGLLIFLVIITALKALFS